MIAQRRKKLPTTLDTTTNTVSTIASLVASSSSSPTASSISSLSPTSSTSSSSVSPPISPTTDASSSSPSKLHVRFRTRVGLSPFTSFLVGCGLVLLVVSWSQNYSTTTHDYNNYSMEAPPPPPTRSSTPTTTLLRATTTTTMQRPEEEEHRMIQAEVVTPSSDETTTTTTMMPPTVAAAGVSPTTLPPTEAANTTTTTTTTTVPPPPPNHQYPDWHMIIAHEPRFDLLGSFVLPTILLLGVAQHHNWTLQILPFYGSTQHEILVDLFAQKGNLSRDWGTGFQDASHRADYNPMELNEASYDTLGFFPPVTRQLNIRELHPWIRLVDIPGPDVCEAGLDNATIPLQVYPDCYILLGDHPGDINNYIYAHGGLDTFVTPAVRQDWRQKFLLHNRHRLRQYQDTMTHHHATETTTPQEFNVAVHIRRGDILDPNRWIDQQVFANVARHICQSHPDRRTNIHVFSAGPNRDGNWSFMEALAEVPPPVVASDESPPSDNSNDTTTPLPPLTPPCARVYFHLDEVEFDSWTFFVAADALVISPSTFSYVPALIRHDNVYYPNNFWHPRLSSFTIFDTVNGNIVTPAALQDPAYASTIDWNLVTDPAVTTTTVDDTEQPGSHETEQVVATNDVPVASDTNSVEANTGVAETVSVSTLSGGPDETSTDIGSDTQWHVIIAHEPRYDLLGSFVVPTVLLYSITQRMNWTLVIFPFAGSPQHDTLTNLFAQKGNIAEDWGSGFQDANSRPDYNPMELNDKSYEAMGFFPDVTNDPNIRTTYPWIRLDEIPQPGKELNDACEAGNVGRNSTECYILLPDDPYKSHSFINLNGGIDAFITSELGQHMRHQFLLKNQDRLKQYVVINQTSFLDSTNQGGSPYQYFNVAVHIRRGDILDPGRWIDQQVYANVAKHICQSNANQNPNIRTNIHVFSSGPNRDGNWSILESLAESTGEENDPSPVCANVYFHLDELEFDSWAFMIAADALVISLSTFSYVPGLIRYENVYFPKTYWHPQLSSFIVFEDRGDGSILAKA